MAVTTGPLDLHTTRFFHERATPAPLILDLTGVTFRDSTGPYTLLRLHRRTQSTGGRLTAAGLPEQMIRIPAVIAMGMIFSSAVPLPKPGRPAAPPGPCGRHRRPPARRAILPIVVAMP